MESSMPISTPTADPKLSTATVIEAVPNDNKTVPKQKDDTPMADTDVSQNVGKATMEFVLSLWDCMTHCVEPENYDEVTDALQDALKHEASKVVPQPQKTAGVEGTFELSEAKVLSSKELEWDSMGVYQITLDDKGTPLADPEWPSTFVFWKIEQPNGENYFQVFKSQNDSHILDTTDETMTKFQLPELKDDDHYVYRFGRKYLYGPASLDAERKYKFKAYFQWNFFNYAEHALMGNRVKLRWSDSEEPILAKNRPLKLENGSVLTYGDINALGGDFFATKQPISTGNGFDEQCELFRKAYATLAQNARGKEEAENIQKILKNEKDAVSNATDEGKKIANTADLYKRLKASDNPFPDEDKNLNKVTTKPDGPSYLGMAQLNLDHFGQDGIAAYHAGHYCAMLAAAGGNLELGYSMNAFADHYLGDSFASGHLRTPRRKLHGSGYDPQEAVDLIIKIVASYNTGSTSAAFLNELAKAESVLVAALDALAPDFCSKFMHDEDNMKGLFVTNKRGDKWQMFGDSKLYDPANVHNARFMIQALQVSADEIYVAHKDPKSIRKDLVACKALDISPSAEQPGVNHQPLFNQNGWYRWDITDPTCTSYSDPMQSSTGFKTLALILIASSYFKDLK